MGALRILDAWYPLVAWPINIALCSGGFLNIIYSFGLGYALSMGSNGLLELRRRRAALLCSPPAVHRSSFNNFAQPCLSLLYGVRLFAFLWRRQTSVGYAAKMAKLQAKTASMPLTSKCIIVGSVGTLIAGYMAPLFYAGTSIVSRLSGKKEDGERSSEKYFVSNIGLGLATLGLIIETVADEQKNLYKSASGGLIESGLYSMARHPNYTGEILFHVGMFLSSWHAYRTWKQLLVAALAPGSMAMVMFGAAKGLDDKQAENYGAAFHAYRKATPYSLFPFIY